VLNQALAALLLYLRSNIAGAQRFAQDSLLSVLDRALLIGMVGWLLWGLAHLAFMPAHENRVTLLTKWLWQIATRERASLLITGRPDQHLDVDVGLQPHPTAAEPAPAQEPASPS
jgi:hypothetical protein